MLNRGFIFGVALGSLFTLSTLASFTSPTKSSLTFEDLQREASLQGYYLQKETAWAVSAIEASPPSVPAEAPTKPATPPKPAPSTLKTSDAKTLPTEALTPPKKGSSVEIVVRSGMTSSEVEGLLVDAKLIPPNSDFQSILRERKLRTRIQTGKFKIEQGSSLGEIVEEITR